MLAAMMPLTRKEHWQTKAEAPRPEPWRANWPSERSGGARKGLLAIQSTLTCWSLLKCPENRMLQRAIESYGMARDRSKKDRSIDRLKPIADEIAIALTARPLHSKIKILRPRTTIPPRKLH